MHVLDPKALKIRQNRRVKNQKRRYAYRVVSALLVLVLVIYVTLSLTLPLPALSYTANQPIPDVNKAVNLKWPNYGQSAIGIVGFGPLESHGDQKPFPIASVAKVVTALAVLKAKPLTTSQPGPDITITAADQDLYNQYLSEGQSVVEVAAGEKISQYQALQALLLPSANNIAVILTDWAFGSQDGYLQFVNNFVESIGMTNTHIADASGYSPNTISTAMDLTKLAENAMDQPVIAQIAAQKAASLPVVGTVYNVNRLLGSNGVIGIKTGNTEEAGGCYMFAAKRSINGQDFTVVGVILGAPSLSTSLHDAPGLIDSTFANIQTKQVIKKGQQYGQITRGGSVSVPIIAQADLSVLAWPSKPPALSVEIDNLSLPIDAHTPVGTIKAHSGSYSAEVKLLPASELKQPSVWYRLFHMAGHL